MSEHFKVSARKYRPQTFAAVVGQASITKTLKNALLQNKLAHAYLFCGPRGVGKTTCARILAKSVNCLSPENAEPCHECASCTAFAQQNNFNIFELDAASNNSVEDIRALTEQVRFPPQGGKYKIFIIDEVHMLSAGAFNAFLKTLEEPPPHVIFILATTEKQKILPTILSRCQIFDFHRIRAEDMVAYLKNVATDQNLVFDADSLALIAQKSEGCMRDALTLLDKVAGFSSGELNYKETAAHLNILDADFYFQLMQYVQEKDIPGVLLHFNTIYAKGFEGEEILNGLADFFRNLLIYKYPQAHSVLDILAHFQARYEALAASLEIAYLLSALNMITESEIQYVQAVNKKLFVELFLLRLTYLKEALDLTQETGEQKKKLADTVPPFLQVRSLPLQCFLKENPESFSVPNPALSEEKVLSEKKEKNSEVRTAVVPIPTVSSASSEILSSFASKEELTQALSLRQAQEKALSQKPLTQSDIAAFKTEYIAFLHQQERGRIAEVLENVAFVYEAPELLRVTITTVYTKEALNKIKTEWLDFLKQQTGRTFILECEEMITLPKDTYIDYPDKEGLFEKMKALNPHIETLRKEWQMDLE